MSKDLITSFFQEAQTIREDNVYWDLACLCVSEFGWSQQDWEQADIPFVLNITRRWIKQQEKQSKQSKKKTRF
jgi:hypothetical protein